MMPAPFPYTIAGLRDAYQRGTHTPQGVIAWLRAQMRAGDPAWIHRCDDAFVHAQLLRLAAHTPQTLPLYGVPFAVKDNIDVEGLPTTAACPAFTHVARRTACAVQRLLDAGAVLLGKTNLDQFATGLVGTRSPYGEVPNSFDAAYVSGGSSSGSASVVARGLVSFALGTDTAGSGRVPAGLNNLVGLKPTPGRVPMAGVVPACRSVDVVSVLALTVADAADVAALMEGAEGEPLFQAHALRVPWLGRGRGPLRVGVPARADCDASLGYDRAFAAALARLEAMGLQVRPVDMTPFFDAARLLYEGPWVAERYAVVQSLIESRPAEMDPVVRAVIERARDHDAVAAFRARYALEDLRGQIAPMWTDIDVLMVPTAATCPTRAAVTADPVLRNSELGRYTNFVNLLGLAALAVPSGMSASGLPFGVTFIGPGGSDAALAAFGARWEAHTDVSLGCRLRAAREADRALRALPAAAPTLEIAVVGAHLEGQPLHGELLERGCRLAARTTTAPQYRLHALPGGALPKPGLARVDHGGTSIEVEVYEMPQTEVGAFLARIDAPLGLGSVQLADGRRVKGFICEPAALHGAVDISRFGGWRAYLASR